MCFTVIRNIYRKFALFIYLFKSSIPNNINQKSGFIRLLLFLWILNFFIFFLIEKLIQTIDNNNNNNNNNNELLVLLFELLII